MFKAAAVGTAGLAGLPLASACGEVSGREGNVQEIDESLDILPTYKEWPLPVQPDLIGDPPDRPSGFLTYPNPVAQAIPNPPANSGEYQIYVPNWGPLRTKDDPYYTAMQEATGGTRIDFIQNDPGSYNEAKVQWIKAQEFGDAIFMQSWMTGAHANFNETVANSFANITDIVSGDISERWPLLAGRGDAAWADSVWPTDPVDPEGTAGIFGVPWHLNGGPGNGVFYRGDLLEAGGFAVPTTVEEILEIARAWSDDRAGKWAFAGTDWMSPAWFGLASGHGWMWDGSGLVHNFERPEYKEWVEFQRLQTDEKLRHPNFGNPDFVSKLAFNAGDVLFDQDGFARWPQTVQEFETTNPDFTIGALGALNFKGRDPLYHSAYGVGGWLFFRKDLEEDSIAELLDVCNFVAAPFGTKEYELITYGLEGEHFEYDDQGRPVFTEAGNSSHKDSFSYTSMCGVTQTLHEGPASYVEARFAFDEAVQPYLEENIFEGLRLVAPDTGSTAGTVFGEKIKDIIYGRAELSEYEAAVEAWRTDGGADSREFFETAYKTLHGE